MAPVRRQKLSNIEIATRQNTINFSQLLGVLPNPDPVLKKLGRDIDVYTETMRDAAVQGCIGSRKAGVMGLNYGIESDQSSPQIQLIDDWIHGNTAAPIDIYRIMSEILDAEQLGYSVLEVIFDSVEGYWLPVKIESKPQEWFRFGLNNELLFLSKKNPFMGEPVPDRQFLLATNQATYNNPYGFAIQSCCFWPVTFKRGGLKFLAVFCEKYGMPYIFGKQPRGTPDAETDDMLEKLDLMVQDGIAVIPDDSSIEILEPGGRSGSNDSYSTLLTYCDAQISLCELGHTGGAIATPGKLGGDNTAMEVRADLVASGKRITEKALNTIINWIWDYNASAGPPPQFSMWPDDDIDKTMAERDEILTRQGLRFTKDYYTRAYGLAETDFDIVPPVQPTQPGAMFSAPVADNGMQQIDTMRQRLQADAGNDELIQTVKDALDSAPDLITFRDKLIELFPKMTTDQLAKTMAMAFTSAELAGRFEINRRLGL